MEMDLKKHMSDGKYSYKTLKTHRHEVKKTQVTILGGVGLICGVGWRGVGGGYVGWGGVEWGGVGGGSLTTCNAHLGALLCGVPMQPHLRQTTLKPSVFE